MTLLILTESTLMINKTSSALSVDIAIIGAGTAGLSAYKEARKYSKNVILIDHGPLGTTCARIGCMPSKVFIQAANYYHDRHKFKERGIEGADHLSISIEKLLNYVRNTRDSFTEGVIKETKDLGSDFIFGHARFINQNQLVVDDKVITFNRFIIAVGMQPIVPDKWRQYGNRILTINHFFEQKKLAKKMVTIGAGAVGLELTQALSRIGIEICAFHSGEFIGPLTDPVINKYAIEILSAEFPIYLKNRADIIEENNKLFVSNQTENIETESILVTVGMKADFNTLSLVNSGASFDENGKPIFDKKNLSLSNSSGFIAGDANGFKPILHEAADEGRIAGYNATHANEQCYARRTPLNIIFTEPNIAVIGKPYKELDIANTVIGEINFSNQGRSKIMSKNIGVMRIYATKDYGEILGSEMICPDGEHLAHLLAWAIEMKLSVYDLLKMPYYHPTVEEGIRTALRRMSKEITNPSLSPLEISLCNSSTPLSLS